jgi:hypothetical protein
MSRRRGCAFCHADYDGNPFSVSVSGSAKWVMQEFPKLVAMVKKLEAKA